MLSALIDRLRERSGVDVDWAVRRVFETLRGHIHLNEQPLPRALRRARSVRFPLWTARSSLFETAHHDRLTVTHIRALPIIDGFTISARPRDAAIPWLMADFFCFPTRVSANIWLFGPPLQGAPFSHPASFATIGLMPTPEWLSDLVSGEGFSVRTTPGNAELLFQAMRAFLASTLARINRVDPSAEPDAPRALAMRIRSSAPFEQRVRRSFGAAFAHRYSDLLFSFDTK